MKTNLTKIIVTIVVIATGITTIMLLKPKGNNDFGQIQLIIENEEVVYDNFLSFNENETLYDLLERNFELTTQDFAMGLFLLSISNDDFSITTNMNNNYLSFYQVVESNEVYLTYGMQEIYLENQMVILIKVVLI